MYLQCIKMQHCSKMHFPFLVSHYYRRQTLCYITFQISLFHHSAGTKLFTTKWIFYIALLFGPVLYTHAHLWFPHSFLAVSHHNNKNWVLSILTNKFVTNFHGDEAKKIKIKKTIQNGRPKKNWVFQNRQFSKFFCKNFMD